MYEANQPGTTPLGILELEQYQINLLKKYHKIFLSGSFEKAKNAFEILFRRAPQDDTEMGIFKALCLKAEKGEL